MNMTVDGLIKTLKQEIRNKANDVAHAMSEGEQSQVRELLSIVKELDEYYKSFEELIEEVEQRVEADVF
jgi:hypothetical protein